MNYTDTQFLMLFALVTLASASLRFHPAPREWLLTIFSLLVIASWGLFGLALFLFMSVLNFFATILMLHSSKRVARIVLSSTIIVDVGTLAVFKYTNFFGGTLSLLTGWPIPQFPLGVPLAISFYTFHMISYLLDVRAGRTERTTFGRYLFYLSFFPHVVAGPIVRAWQLIPQLHRVRPIRANLLIGFHFIVTGFFLKSVVADNIAGGIDPAWQASAALTPADHWMVAILYYCQIYGDFAGYSLMALGMARLLGYRLPANFRRPLAANSLREFWRRWHITLSRWLRDYVYFGLGGSRGNQARTAANMLLTMLLGGIWHGAGWGFLLWGAMHGGALIVERALGLHRSRPFSMVSCGWWMVVQLWVVLAWVPFRAPDIQSTLAMLKSMGAMFTTFDLSSNGDYGQLFLFAIPVIAHQFAPTFMRATGHRNIGVLIGVTTAILLALDIMVMAPSKVFIYFRF